MDKYESKLRIEEIEKLKKKRQYKEAARLADTIEWYRIKNAVTLYKIADLYKICRNYTKCRELLELAYERSPYAKNVIFALCDVCLEFGDFEAATEYYKEYVSLAPNDSGVWILKYKMLKALDAGIDERIGILETLKRKDRIEEWEYELATLYHRAGLAEKCVEECDEIILWFGEGSYVYKAMELKMLHEPLTREQQEVYNRRVERKAELAARKESRQTGRMQTGKIQTGRMKKFREEEQKQKEASPGETRVMDKPEASAESEEEFRVKTINMGQFNTIDLQAELAANVQGYIGGEPSMIDRSGMESLPEDPYVTGESFGGKGYVDKEYSEEASIEEYANSLPEAAEEASAKVQPEVSFGTIPADAKEVFFEDSTQDLRYQVSLPETPKGDNARLKEFKERYSREMEGKELPEGFGRLSGDEEVVYETTPIAGGIVDEKVLDDGTVELIKQFSNDYEPEVVMVGRERKQDRVRKENRPLPSKPMRAGRDEEILDPDYVNMLPTSEDKQISGQLNITDILAGWEEKKKETERAFQEEMRKKALANTGNLFADFDKEANSGILATLENPALINSVTEQSSAKDFIKGISVEDMKKGKKPRRFDEEEETAAELKIGRVIEAQPDDAEYEDISGDEAKRALRKNVEGFVLKKAEDKKLEDTDERMIRELLEADEKEAREKEEKKEPESLYYGSVTANISGSIWDEVDNVKPVQAEKKPEEAYEEKTVAEEAQESAGPAEGEVPETAVVSEEEPAEELPETGTETKEPEEETEAYAETEDDPEATRVMPSVAAAVEETVSEEQAEETTEEAEESQKKEEPAPERTEGKPKKKKRKPAPVAAEDAGGSKEEDITEEEGAEEESAPGKENGNDLSKDAKKFFSPFLYSKKMKQQIMDAVENISLAAYTGNLIITADSSDSSGKLATIFYQYLKASDPNFTGKAAKIGAEKLNKKDMGEIFEKLSYGALIVSHAGKMTNSTINAILQNLNQDARGVEVILHDTRSEIRRLLERAAVLERFFNCRVDIIAVSAEMLAEYGKKYAEEKGYSIDDLAMLAFSGRISELQIGTHMVSVDEVKELVDSAIEHVNKPSPDKAFRTMTGKRYDEEHRVILREKDFEFRK